MVTVSAPTDEIPIFARGGAVVPMLDPEVWTLAEHGDDPSIVHASDRADRLHVIAFPRGQSEGRFYREGTWRSEEGDDTWLFVVDGDIERMIHLEASLAVLEAPFEPCAVSLDDSPIPTEDWSYDDDSRVLEVRYETAGASLLVSGC
jgi:hypothetical protein